MTNIEHKCQNSVDKECINLWYNSDLKIENKSVYYNNFACKGIYYVEDLLDEEGNFFSHEKFVEFYNVKVNFLRYLSLVNATKNYLGKMELDKSELSKLTGPKLPFCVRLLNKKDSVCKVIGKFFCWNDATPNSQNAFSENGFQITNDMWKKYYTTPYKCTTDSSLQWLQYRILHRILATNSFLYKIKVTQSDRCTFCNLSRETIEHVLYECIFVEKFFLDVSAWLLSKKNLHITFSRKMIIFGVPAKRENKDTSWFMLQCKKFIYNSR